MLIGENVPIQCDGCWDWTTNVRTTRIPERHRDCGVLPSTQLQLGDGPWNHVSVAMPIGPLEIDFGGARRCENKVGSERVTICPDAEPTIAISSSLNVHYCLGSAAEKLRLPNSRVDGCYGYLD